MLRMLASGIARQYWRAWIETRGWSYAVLTGVASPASIGGRGLKLWLQLGNHAMPRIARQYWRAWIETT